MKTVYINIGLPMVDGDRETVDNVCSVFGKQIKDRVTFIIDTERHNSIGEMIDCAKEKGANFFIYMIGKDSQEENIEMIVPIDENPEIEEFIESFNYVDENHQGVIIQKQILITDNGIPCSIGISYSKSYIDEITDNAGSCVGNALSRLIAAFFSLYFPRVREAKINQTQDSGYYKVRLVNGKFEGTEVKSLEKAIACCDRYANAVVVNSLGEVVHKSIYHKVMTGGVQKQKTAPKYVNSRVPSHIIKKTTGVNKF